MSVAKVSICQVDRAQEYTYYPESFERVQAMSTTTAIERNKDVLGGVPVFAHTRVPVQTLLDYLSEGQRLDEFLEDFPTVTHEQATEVLDYLKHYILTQQYEHSA
jgi:uncharacterized protein (DUF433 family)